MDSKDNDNSEKNPLVPLSEEERKKTSGDDRRSNASILEQSEEKDLVDKNKQVEDKVTTTVKARNRKAPPFELAIPGSSRTTDKKLVVTFQRFSNAPGDYGFTLPLLPLDRVMNTTGNRSRSTTIGTKGSLKENTNVTENPTYDKILSSTDSDTESKCTVVLQTVQIEQHASPGGTTTEFGTTSIQRNPVVGPNSAPDESIQVIEDPEIDDPPVDTSTTQLLHMDQPAITITEAGENIDEINKPLSPGHADDIRVVIPERITVGEVIRECCCGKSSYHTCCYVPVICIFLTFIGCLSYVIYLIKSMAKGHYMIDELDREFTKYNP